MAILKPDAASTASTRQRVFGVISRYPLIIGALILLAGYWSLGLGWRDACLSALVYGVVAYLLLRLTSINWARPLTAIWAIIFSIDLGIKAFLIAVYQTKPDAVLIMDAIGNTSSGESREFIEQYWRLIGQYALVTGVFGALLMLMLRTGSSAATKRRRWPALVCLLAFALLQLNPTFRSTNPLYFWPDQVSSYNQFQQRLVMLEGKRQIAESKLPAWHPQYTGPARDTAAVILGESTSRWDWQLYGYARPTTPQLMKQASDLLIFRDVISGAGGTIASFRLMLTPRELSNKLDDESEPSVVMLAKASGYKTFWISNQQDRYINPRFAEEADVVHLINVGGGRSDSYLDEDVLPYWTEALRDPAPRKLIIVHLLGAHPRYAMRSPAAFKRFDDADDIVAQRLRQAGRNPWVRFERDDYDNAMLYQDHIIASLLDSLKASLGGGDGSLLFTSDHAQEVGHTRNFAGHSGDEAGQVVPLLIWMSTPLPTATSSAIEQRPYQTDRLDWTLLDLLRIKTGYDQPGDSLLSPDYRARPRYLVNAPTTPYVPSTDTGRP